MYFSAEQEKTAKRQAEDERTSHVRVLQYGLFGGPEGVQHRKRFLHNVVRVDSQLLQQGWLVIKIICGALENQQKLIILHYFIIKLENI